MVILVALALLVAFCGHVAMWVSFWNHTEGSAMPKWMRRWLNRLGKICLLGLPLWFPLVGGVDLLIAHEATRLLELRTLLGLTYLSLCWGFALYGIPFAIWRRHSMRNPACQLSRRGQVHLLKQPHEQSTARGLSGLLLRFPGNQVFDLEATEKELRLEHLPESLDGFSLVHLSDLHFTGKIPRAYFEQMVQITNDWQPDLITITGDLVDRNACLEWLPTLGQLRSRLGTHYVLGNHDMKVDQVRLRRALQEIGLIACGGRWRSLTESGSELILAGNELPWVPPAVDMRDCPLKTPEQLRILLAHTPDQLAWAKHHHFDLMLAGHTHGGQICLPWIGPVLCPSRKPLEYCVGTIHEPPTVMHVSRGVSGEVPIRLNCRPEITRLVLRAARLGEAEKAESRQSAIVVPAREKAGENPPNAESEISLTT